jgi:hypothetical protein
MMDGMRGRRRRVWGMGGIADVGSIGLVRKEIRWGVWRGWNRGILVEVKKYYYGSELWCLYTIQSMGSKSLNRSNSAYPKPIS